MSISISVYFLMFFIYDLFAVLLIAIKMIVFVFSSTVELCSGNVSIFLLNVTF